VNRIHRQGVEDIKIIFGALKKLKRLRLDLPESYFGDLGGKALAEGLEVLEYVEHLDLNVAFNDMKDYGAEEITKSVVGLKGLKTLNLSLSDNELQNESSLKIVRQLAARAATLQQLNVYFLNTAINNRTKDTINETFAVLKNAKITVNSILNPEYAANQEAEEGKTAPPPKEKSAPTGDSKPQADDEKSAPENDTKKAEKSKAANPDSEQVDL
jgi:hypothetical protein